MAVPSENWIHSLFVRWHKPEAQKITLKAETSHMSLMSFTGWRVSAEQQVSDMELQKLKAARDGHQPKGQLPNPTLENMKEAAYSIYEQYLSEKVNSYIIEQGKQCCVSWIGKAVIQGCPKDALHIFYYYVYINSGIL
jgi:hypothetical protein